MKNLQRLVIGLLAMILMVAGAVAQQTNSRIVGSVSDKDGNPLPGVSVKAISPKLVGSAVAISDENGVFRLLALAPGVYGITFQLEGFQTIERQNIVLGLEQTLTIKIAMELGTIQETIMVRGQAPLIDVKSAAKAMTLTKEVFQTLPKGRNFDSLVTAIPGVSAENKLGGTSVDGASGLENTYYVDGMDTGDMVRGARGQSVSIDFVDEVQVKASGYQAEYGGSLGGVLSVITRSGGNEFHGEVVGYYGNSVDNVNDQNFQFMTPGGPADGAPLVGKARDVLRLNPLDPTKAEYVNYDDMYGRDKVHHAEMGFSLGGYIFKDKLWFFASFLPTFNNIKRNVEFLDNNTGSDFTQKSKAWNFAGKLTSQPFKALRLGGSFVSSSQSYEGYLPLRNGTQSSATPWGELGRSFPNLSASVAADLTLGNNLLISARGGYFLANANNPLYAPDGPVYNFIQEAPGGYPVTTNIGMAGIPAQYLRPAGFSTLPQAFAVRSDRQKLSRVSANADFTYFLNLLGEHSWKVGVQFVRQGDDEYAVAQHPIVYFAWDRSVPGSYSNLYDAAGKKILRGAYGWYGVRSNAATGYYGNDFNPHNVRWALYLQDSWTIANRLTLNFGIRTENEYIPSYSHDPRYKDLKPFNFSFADKLAPRLGFVYDIFGNSSLKIFGSFGYFFDTMKLSMAAGSFGGNQWYSAYYTLDTYEWDKIGKDGYFPGKLFRTKNWRTPGFNGIDPDIKPFGQREISFGAEKKISENLVASVRVVNKHLLKVIEDVGYVNAVGDEEYLTTNPGYGISLPKSQGGVANDLYPACPKGIREYWAVNVSVEKRFSDNWMGGMSYTWSRLRGNYSGLASADELNAQGVGRTDPNVARFWDSWVLPYDKNLNLINGPLPTDRPHYFKIFGSYAFPFGLTLGTVVNAMSGTPVSEEWMIAQEGYMPFGRGNLGRTPFLWFTNLYAEYNLKLGKNVLSINLNVDNLFNAATAQRIWNIRNRNPLDVSDEQLLSKKWDISDFETLSDPRFKQELDFFSPISARIGMSYRF